MKKVMLAVIVGVLAVVANAASLAWDIDGSYVPGSEDLANGYICYFFNDATYSQSSAIAAVGNKDKSFISKAVGDPVLTDEGWTEGSVSGLTAGSDVTGYLVIFNAGTADAATMAYVSDTASVHMPGSGADGYLQFGDLVEMKSTAAWSSVGGSGGGVPEPTSGLLLLVGGALLALRRKQK